MKSMSGIWSCVKASAAALCGDSRGVAATEFALILPMMLVMFFGTVEVSSGVAANRKITLVARTPGNPLAMANAVRDAIWSVDREQTITSISTFDQLLRLVMS